MSAATAEFRRIFDEIANDTGPSQQTIRDALEAILAGAWTPVQVAGFAIALRMRGEHAATISAAAQTLCAHMIEVRHGLPLVADTCGTGGDGQGSINLSTAAAFVVAAAGIAVAKHGGRSVSSLSGSADVLEALGVSIDVSPDKQADVLREAGIAFLFAPAHHPALRHSAAARRELAVRTIFNTLGPLANPARATHRLLGVYDHALRPVLASALRDLGATRAWVVRSDDGLDEVSPFAPTRVTDLARGKLFERIIRPQTFGLKLSASGAIAGGDAKHNASVIRSVFEGRAHPARDAIVLNAAAAIAICRDVDEERLFPALAEEAASLIDDGHALRVLDTLCAVTARART